MTKPMTVNEAFDIVLMLANWAEEDVQSAMPLWPPPEYKEAIDIVSSYRLLTLEID